MTKDIASKLTDIESFASTIMSIAENCKNALYSKQKTIVAVNCISIKQLLECKIKESGTIKNKELFAYVKSAHPHKQVYDTYIARLLKELCEKGVIKRERWGVWSYIN